MNENEDSKPENIGAYIKQLAEEQNLNPTAFGRRINKTANNVKDIYTRSSIDSELLLQISKGLNKNIFAYYDDEEPIASFKKAELEEWESKIEKLNTNIENLQTEKEFLEHGIQDLTKRIADQEDVIRLLKEKEQFLNKRN